MINEDDFCKLNETYFRDKLSEFISFPYQGFCFSWTRETSFRLVRQSNLFFFFNVRLNFKLFIREPKGEKKTFFRRLAFSCAHDLDFQLTRRQTLCCTKIIDRSSGPQGVLSYLQITIPIFADEKQLSIENIN